MTTDLIGHWSAQTLSHQKSSTPDLDSEETLKTLTTSTDHQHPSEKMTHIPEDDRRHHTQDKGDDDYEDDDNDDDQDLTSTWCNIS